LPGCSLAACCSHKRRVIPAVTLQMQKDNVAVHVGTLARTIVGGKAIIAATLYAFQSRGACHDR